MKQIVFVRHGKSSWEYNVDDKDRPLKLRGIHDAHLVSNHLRPQLPSPDGILSSPANRALHTCMIFVRNLGLDTSEVRIDEALYDFGGSSVLHVLQSLPEEWQTVMIFGHNHAFTSLVNSLGDASVHNVPTSGAFGIRFQTNQWKQITNETGQTFIQLTPKALK